MFVCLSCPLLLRGFHSQEVVRNVSFICIYMQAQPKFWHSSCVQFSLMWLIFSSCRFVHEGEVSLSSISLLILFSPLNDVFFFFFINKLSWGTGGGFPEWGRPFTFGFEGGTCALHCLSPRN
ncbi:hypothetical protein RchiOBHm_Chr7g0185621 [Rosa chinensis]|uniref:Uncharacterized protein n=2 Tax=Rosa chinensis TaxID=74649 RepID=A0A2P6P3Q8_ROSCH|nr:hypothetical protein RchiOBHm_Chr7g0185621 [Rosa chinensis]